MNGSGEDFSPMWLADALWIKTRAHAKSCMNINHPAVGSVSSTGRGQQEWILQTVASVRVLERKAESSRFPFSGMQAFALCST